MTYAGSMNETKSHQFRPPLYHEEDRPKAGGQGTPRQQRPRQERDPGWEAYRKWLSTVSAKSQSERAPVDRSIYSWKGYHIWADKVKQAWKSEDN